MTDPTYLPPVNQDAALAKKTEIDTLLGQINTHELRLARSYARLGAALKEVKVEQYWISYGYDRFSSYLESIWTTIGKKRSQVYAILSVSETLLPVMTESELEDVGITKAYELQRLVKGGGRVDAEITDPDNQTDDIFGTVQLLDYASRPGVTAALLRVKVNEQLHVHENPPGLWYELPGFYATTDERKEIADFWSIGQQVLQITSEHEYEIHKEVFLAAVRESLGQWKVELAND